MCTHSIFKESCTCDDENINLAKMGIYHLYMVCLFVVMSVILSYYYIGIVRDTKVRLTDADDKNIPFQMLQRVQDALKDEQLPGIGFDDDLMSRAIQAGSRTRLKNVLKKALRGEDINLMVIGGSNSAGGKLGLDENSLDGLYFKVFARWWNNTFGEAVKSFMKDIQLTIGGTGSPFFAFCYKTFLGEGKKIDIVLIEISTNDIRFRAAKHLEQLTRQVLEYPSAPALLYINLIGNLGPKAINPTCINLETFGQTELARHYEMTTSFSLKEIFCRKNEKGQWNVIFTNMTASDGNHIGLKAHDLIASLISKHVKSVTQELINDVYNAADQVDGGNESSSLPKYLLIENETKALKKPLCWTGKTPNALKNLHNPNLQLEVINKTKFLPCFQMKGQKTNVRRVTKELRTDSRGGWCAWKGSSTLQFKIYVPTIGVDSVFGSRSVIVLSKFSSKGEAAIWLDNNEEKAIKINSTNIKNEKYDTIATRVNPGYHTITIRTLRDCVFVVSGVLIGPPDFLILD